ncbi:MAG: molybdopterin-dependent oxidoreductase [Deltaproteobacteria bacterium]|nr:MAG: molybdopterin-dependent oxidoreductase [Deltaproteobacteria bacterium]
MKLDRRAFVKLIAGGVGGTLLSPLPWKLADDTAIWTQNWFWRPSPERGGASTVNTVCQLCPGGCGISVRLINDRNAVNIDGNPTHPVNQGGICPLGAAGLQFLYGPSRIETPLQQTGKRGDLKTFKPISWDEALQILASQLQKMRQQTTGLVCVSGKSEGTVPELFSRFLQAYGSPNYLTMPAAADAQALGSLVSQGTSSPIGYDLENAKMVMSFGCSYIEGWTAPSRMMAAFGGWRSQTNRSRTRTVQVEARGSLSASKADEWVAVVPGTEAALALGLAQVIVSEGLYDRSFIGQHTHGFEEFRSLLRRDYTPEKVAGITQVDKSKIVALARDFARTKPAVALHGLGQGRMPGSVYDFLAVQSLNALVGSLHQAGGMSRKPQLPLAPWPEVVLDATSLRGKSAPRVDGAGGSQFPLSTQVFYNFVNKAKEGRVQPGVMLWVYEANPVHNLADAQSFTAALEKMETVVSFSSFMDETTQLADLVLPGPTYLERLEDVPTPPGLQYRVFGLSNPVLNPRFETRHPGDVLIQLAKSLGGSVAASFPWSDYEAALRERVKGLANVPSGRVADEPGIEPWNVGLGQNLEPNYGSFDELWEKLTEYGCWFDTSEPMPSWDSAFKTPTGKFEFFCQKMRQVGIEGSIVTYLPHYAPVEPAGDTNTYPLVLVPYESMAITNGPVANPPFMTKLLFDFQLKGNDSFVEINPETAGRAGLREGDRVELQTERGTVKVRVHLTQAARPGVVFIPTGLGHTAFDSFIKGKGVNANEILVVRQEQITGLATWWDTRVKISKI